MSPSTSVHVLLLLLALAGVLLPVHADESESPLSSGSSCPGVFRSRCECRHQRFGVLPHHYYVVNCTNAGFDDPTVLRHLPPETEVLIVTGNNFAELPINLLLNDTSERLGRLFHVDLSANNISRIHGKAFHGMNWVQSLVLSNNHISLVGQSYRPRMFMHLERLQELHLVNAFNKYQMSDEFMHALGEMLAALKKLNIIDLGNNSIAAIDSHFFCNNTDLVNIGLADNALTRYAINASCLAKLNAVDVSNNQISSPDNTTIEYFQTGSTRSYHINLAGNALVCECPLLDFYRFVRRVINETAGVKFDSLEKYRCQMDMATNVSRAFDTLTESDLNCHRYGGLILDAVPEVSGHLLTPEQVAAKKRIAFLRHQSYVNACYIVLGFLSLLLVVMLSILVVSNHEGIFGMLSHYWHVVTNKREYSALDKDNNETGTESTSTGSGGGGRRNKGRFEMEVFAEDTV